MTKPNGSQSASAVVSIIVYVRGVPKGEHHTVSVHWYIQNVDVGLTPNSNVSAPVTADANVLFTLAYPEPGWGTARIFLDLPGYDTSNPTTDPHLAATINFGILPPNTGTPTAPASKTASPPASMTPSPSPVPHASLGGGGVAWRGQPALSWAGRTVGKGARMAYSNGRPPPFGAPGGLSGSDDDSGDWDPGRARRGDP